MKSKHVLATIILVLLLVVELGEDIGCLLFVSLIIGLLLLLFHSTSNPPPKRKKVKPPLPTRKKRSQQPKHRVKAPAPSQGKPRYKIGYQPQAKRKKLQPRREEDIPEADLLVLEDIHEPPQEAESVDPGNDPDFSGLLSQETDLLEEMQTEKPLCPSCKKEVGGDWKTCQWCLHELKKENGGDGNT